ncbi:MAG: c-type cytochrome [Actinobacteria bacterium]|nr:MAG: c-type cytochrome [Actinomycetota bacterium]
MRTAVARLPRRLRAGVLVAGGAAALVGLGGCAVKHAQGDLVNGKKLFVAKCGSCHVLNRAATKGTVGPNLDQAFDRALHDGFQRSVVREVVEKQILYPNINGVMPAKLVRGQAAVDVAAYVGYAVARQGKDTGALAAAVGAAQQALATEQNGALTIPANPTGQLLYTFKNAQAKPGPVTIQSPNKSTVPHDISIQGNGLNQNGPVVSNGGTSTLKVTLKPGTYTFYCSVDAHRQAGMVGQITVK